MSRHTRSDGLDTAAPRRMSVMRAVGAALSLSFLLAGTVMAADITVNTTADEPLTDPDNGNCTLREAIEAVKGTQVDACPPGVSGLDRILLTGLSGTINLVEALVLHNGTYDIVGPGARQLTISGQNNVRIFDVLGTPNPSLRTVSDITITQGRGPDGGGIINKGRLTVKNVSFVANFADEDGGAIANDGTNATLIVLNCTFSGNGGIEAGAEEEEGGAIVNIDGLVTIANSTFSGNSVPNTGGAIHNSGNNDGTGDVTVINSTISGNDAMVGGAGIFIERGARTILRNTLIAGNTGTNCELVDPGSQFIDEGGNLDDGTTCLLTQNTSISNGFARLDPAGLQNKGGPTDTIALSVDPMSDAIDSGVPAFCADPATVNNLDQRGAPFIRPTDGDGDGNPICDIGAFESPALVSGPNQPPVVTNPGNQTGVVGANVSLAVSAADPDGDTLSYSAAGLPAGLTINSGTGLVTGTLSGAGVSNVTVTVTDNRGGTASTPFTWTVTSSNPGPAPLCVGRPATIYVLDGIVFGGPDDGLPYSGLLRGTDGRDVMVGTAGIDTINGLGGNDRICGGRGQDRLNGGAGNDKLFGEGGKDRLNGGKGSDRCDGGAGRDTARRCERALNL